jgi:hypothetical protein
MRWGLLAIAACAAIGVVGCTTERDLLTRKPAFAALSKKSAAEMRDCLFDHATRAQTLGMTDYPLAVRDGHGGYILYDNLSSGISRWVFEIASDPEGSRVRYFSSINRMPKPFELALKLCVAD